MIFMPDIDWKHVIGAQVYYPLSIGTEKLTGQSMLGVLVGLAAVLFIWFLMWEMDFGPLGKSAWVREHLLRDDDDMHLTT